MYVPVTQPHQSQTAKHRQAKHLHSAHSKPINHQTKIVKILCGTCWVYGFVYGLSVDGKSRRNGTLNVFRVELNLTLLSELLS